jgi:hypothetical protein
MVSITSLSTQLADANLVTPLETPITLHESDDFGWNPDTAIVSYDPSHVDCASLLLHEVGHALLGHVRYDRDIELLAIERQAWDKALSISENYGVVIDPDLIEDTLDTYRDWLHSRSLCPSCGATGLQVASKTYSCPSCHQKWHVNEARSCELRRYKTK